MVIRRRVSPEVMLAIGSIASSQFGLIRRDQAMDLGAASNSIAGLVREGVWTRVAPSVYRVSGSVSSWEQEVMLAALSAGDGAVASHQTAALLWKLGDLDPHPIHVATTRPRWRRRSFTVHRLTDLAEPHLTQRSGIPVTTPTRTVLDIAAVVPPWTTERVLDAALRGRLTSVEALAELVDDLSRQGKRGVKLVRRLVEARADWKGITESELEDRFRRLVQAEALPLPLAQFDVRVDGKFLARVDFAYPEQLVAVELDGYAYHSDQVAFARDRERQNRVLMAGFKLLRYTARDLIHRPEQVAFELREALAFPVNLEPRRGV